MANRGVNKVILVGHLGNDPEIRHMQNGGAVANLTIATSESWQDRNTGQQQERTEWHRVVIYGKLAEIAGEYLRKGSQVYLEGQLKTRKWQNQQGQDQYTTEVVLQGFNGVMQMLGGRQNNDASMQQSSYAPYQSSQQNNNYNSAPQQYNNAPAQAPQQNQNQYQQQQSQPASAPPPQQSQPKQQAQSFDNAPDLDFDDDIPF